MEGRSARTPAEPSLILVDSSAWIAYFSSTPSEVQRTLDLLLETPLRLATTGLVVCEVLQGVRHERQRKLIQSTLLAIPMLPEPQIGTYLAAAGIYRSARRRGVTIRGTIDCVLAAQCMQSGADILHRDRDFDAIARVAPLKVHPGRLATP